MAEAEPKRAKVDDDVPQPVRLIKKVQNLEMRERIDMCIHLDSLTLGSRGISLIENTVEGYKVKVQYQLRETAEVIEGYEYYMGMGRRVVVAGGDRANPEGLGAERMGPLAFRRRQPSRPSFQQPPEYSVEVTITSERGDSKYLVDVTLHLHNDPNSKLDKATGPVGTVLRLKTTVASVITNGAVISCKIAGTMSPAAFKPDAYLHAKAMMNQMYLERETTGDLTIETKTGTHKVHGWLLSRQSEMFEAMLTHDMKEKQERMVKMENFEDAVVLNLLEFLYTGWTDSVNTDPQSLLSIAHMFQVDTLITRCWDTFMANLSVETAVGLLLLADKLGAVEQKKKIGKFLLDHHDAIRKTDEFKQLVNQNSRLYLEICDM